MTPNTRQHADDVLVQALTAGKRVAEAAALAGVSTRTVFRRLQDHDFKERLTEVRTAAMTSAAGRLSDHLVRACEVLTDLVWVDDPHLRLKAARAAIELTLKVQAHQDAQANAPANWGPLVVIGEPDPGPGDEDGEEDRGPDDAAPGPVTRGPGPGQPPGGAWPGGPPAGPVVSREGFGAGGRLSASPAGPVAEDSPRGVPKSDKCCQPPGAGAVGAASCRPRFAVPKADARMSPRLSGHRPGLPLSCGKDYKRSSGCVRGARALASRYWSRDNPILRVTSASDRVGQRPAPAEPGRTRGPRPDKPTRVGSGSNFGARCRRGNQFRLPTPAMMACPVNKLTPLAPVNQLRVWQQRGNWVTGDEWFREFERHLLPASERNAELAAVAACRRVWHLMVDSRHQDAVEAAERLADGALTERGFQAALTPVVALWAKLPPATAVEWEPGHYMTGATRHLGSRGAAADALSFAARGAARAAGPRGSAAWLATQDAEGAALLAVIADIVGPPSRPPGADADWRTSTVAALAAGIYADGAFDRLPILADALQDAGCDNADILDHCRGPGPHVRGCWVVDLVLGKE